MNQATGLRATRIAGVMVRSVVVLAAALHPLLVAACSCAWGNLGPREGIADMLAEADAVVLAKATIVTPARFFQDSESPDAQLTQFKPVRAWKGNVGNPFQTKISTVCCMCGVAFEPGETYLLFLSGPDREGFYSTGACVGARLAQPVTREEKMRLLDELAGRGWSP